MDTSVWSDLEDWPSSFTCPITLEASAASALFFLPSHPHMAHETKTGKA
jgi:hypothetical protein